MIPRQGLHKKAFAGGGLYPGMEAQIYWLAIEDIAEEFENAAGEHHT